MRWPLSQDYNEAIQSPESSFVDLELRGGEVATNAMGLPMPCSGNFADVYRLNCPVSKRSWAVKCFTRQIPGLQERYQQISLHLQQGKPSFMVDFTFLERGIQVRRDWYPIVKMQWVEGLTLNQFVKSNLDKPQVLDMLCQLWVKLAVRLREANIAHCDLQHGNVLLVPGSKSGALAVRLVDYDGMCLPSLTLLKSIEVGHPAYQHPQRLREGIYSLEVDRFSHLVIYTALRSLLTAGPALWQRYDNGDNLLFCKEDFQAPARSRLFYELLKLEDASVRALAEQLFEAARKPLEQTPLLEELVMGVPPAASLARQVRIPVAAANSRQPVPLGLLDTPGAKAAVPRSSASTSMSGMATGAGEQPVDPSPFNLPPMTSHGGGGALRKGNMAVSHIAFANKQRAVAAVVCLGGLLLAGLLSLWVSGVFRVKTKECVLVVHVNEPYADVYVDGEPVTVTWSAGGKKGETRVKPGTRQVSVRKDGFRSYDWDVTLEDGERQSITARLERTPPRVAKTSEVERPVGEKPQLEPPVVKGAQPEPNQPAPKFTNGLGMEFVLVPKGKFFMGGGGGKPTDKEVEIPHDFYLGVYDVTQGEWETLMDDNPSWFSRNGGGKDAVTEIADGDLKRFPVEKVSWDDAQEFIQKLNARENPVGWVYGLPTEAEWEYACRGGAILKEDSVFDFYFDRPSNDLSSNRANFNGNFPAGNAPKGKYLQRTTKVGSYAPNRLGFYDMHGNVWQWCADSEGSDRGIRGGGWTSSASGCRAADRDWSAAALRLDGIGFRLARVPVGKETPTIVPEEKKTPPVVEVNLPTKFPNSLGMKFALVPKGKSWLGGGGGKRGTQEVDIPHDFYLGVYVVTQQEWQKLMGSNPSHFSRTGGGKDRVKGISDEELKWFPVENVSWDDAQSFLKLLNARVNEPGWLYRLPTEAEWEYTCRGGPISKEDSASDFCFDRPSNDLSSGQANFNGNFPAGNAPKGKYLQRTTKVGSYAPNRLGFYDMHGNVWQWCAGSDGSVPVIRGGSWSSSGSLCRAADRSWYGPSARLNDLGFRLARVPSGS